MLCVCCGQACCNGQTCSQRTGLQCKNTSGVPIGAQVPCDPNPCCPTCDPYVQDTSIKNTVVFKGRCCRATYIDDGHGACCPPGQDCCRGRFGSAGAGAENGFCCPPSKPFCCEGSNGITLIAQCQSYPAVAETSLGGMNGCASSDITTTLSLPFSPCTIQFNADPGRVLRSGGVSLSTGYTVRLQMGSVDDIHVVPLVFQFGNVTALYCKPPGVTQATITISDVQLYSETQRILEPCFEFRNAGGGVDYVAAWIVSLVVVFPCDCNPLP